MNPETVNNYTEESETRLRQPEEADIVVNDTEPKLLTPQKISNEASATTVEWQKYGEKIGNFLQDLPNYIGRIFTENKSLLGVLGIFFVALIAVKFPLAILCAINDLPFVAPTFQLVGFGVTAWFVYRYLVRASNRQELSTEIKSLKQQFLGEKS